MTSPYDVAVVGAGAAGIAAGQRLSQSGRRFVLIEARDRIGGRTHTVTHAGHGLDLGAGWLHSADRNMMVGIAEAAGFEIDRTAAPWSKQTGEHGMSGAEQEDFRKAFSRFEKRVDEEAREVARTKPQPASYFLEPDCRWNPLLDAVFSYISGAHLKDIDAVDYANYEDTGVNWRVRQGYGALIATLGQSLPVQLNTEVRSIRQTSDLVRVGTTQGEIEAQRVIVALPPWALIDLDIDPALEVRVSYAHRLPLGHAEKVHFALAQAEEFPADGHLFANTNSADTGSYHLRPMGRDMIEVYFGGALAKGLAQAGPDAMADFAKHELAGLLGSQFPARLTLLAASSWATDPYARGSYSYAITGGAGARGELSGQVGRLYFAGEACSPARYSTVHGAWETGHNAAEWALRGAI